LLFSRGMGNPSTLLLNSIPKGESCKAGKALKVAWLIAGQITHS